jgi:carbonic anhydrase/acetyltransferase-like protein (isoleucine patch superfamily)
MIGESSFLAPNATIIGDVIVEDHCSVWFNAVIRGDVNSIRIGSYTNIQDAVVIHGTYLKAGTTISSFVSIGHSAVIHGCTILDHVLIGMGSIIMDDAIVQPYCIIGAGSLILQGTVCESGFLYLGSPAKKTKPITTEQRDMLDKLPHNYVMYSEWFADLKA